MFCRNQQKIHKSESGRASCQRPDAEAFVRENLLPWENYWNAPPAVTHIADASPRIYKVPSRAIYLSGRMQESCNRILSLSLRIPFARISSIITWKTFINLHSFFSKNFVIWYSNVSCLSDGLNKDCVIRTHLCIVYYTGDIHKSIRCYTLNGNFNTSISDNIRLAS